MARRQRDKPDIIDWQEMENDPGLKGNTTFMAPVVPISGVPGFGVPKSDVPDLPLGLFSDKQQRRVRPARNVQDGHTHTEQALYQAMYRLGTPITGTDRRRVTVGTRTLAAQACMSHSTCQSNLASLARKLAIIPEGQISQHTHGKTYTVLGFTEIMQRRRDAGMTHVCRVTKGVSLCGPDVPGFGVPDFNSGVPDLGNSGVPGFGTYIGNSQKEGEKEKTSSSSGVIPAAVAQHCGLALDDAAADRIIEECRKYDHDATEEEVAHFVTVKLDQMRDAPVKNWQGMLIKYVPLYFKPPATVLQMLRRG